MRNSRNGYSAVVEALEGRQFLSAAFLATGSVGASISASNSGLHALLQNSAPKVNYSEAERSAHAARRVARQARETQDARDARAERAETAQTNGTLSSDKKPRRQSRPEDEIVDSTTPLHQRQERLQNPQPDGNNQGVKIIELQPRDPSEVKIWIGTGGWVPLI
ncbi:MAG TPA: hypothetical protein VIL86_00475 [Tepidisphaeraceae bacterium]|jgi:hypothetical protein